MSGAKNILDSGRADGLESVPLGIQQFAGRCRRDAGGS